MQRSLLGVLLAVLLGLGFVLTAAPASAQKKQSVASLIKKGQDYFDEQAYEESIQTLSAALMRPGIAKKEKVQVYKLLAYNYIVLNRTEEADGAVRGLLVLDESFELPETESPRFRDFFNDTRDKWEEEGKPGQEKAGAPVSQVKIKHTPPAQVDEGASISLSGTVEDPEASVAKVNLYYRAGSSGKFQTAKVKYAMRKFSVDIPSDVVEPPLVEYYLQAVNEDGLPVATRGDAEAPVRVAVPESGGVLSSPWFWIPVSIAVVAAVIIPVVIVATAESDSTVTVNVFER